MIFICHFLYYWSIFWAGWYVFYQISGLRLPWKKLLPVSLVSTIIIYLASWTGVLVDFVHLYVIGRIFFKFLSRKELLFYTIYSVIVLDFLLRILYYLAASGDPNMVELTIYSDIRLALINLLVIPVYWLIRKIFHLDFKAVSQNSNTSVQKFFNQIIVVFLIYYIFLHLIYLLAPINDPRLEWINNNHGKIVLIGGLAIAWLLFGISRWGRRLMLESIEHDRALHIANLESYNHRVESLYDELNNFKKNYQISLQKLAKSIASRDMEKVKATYKDILGQADGQTTYASQLDVGKLSAIHVSPIKSMLSSKILQAQEAGLEVSIEAPDEIDEIPMKIVDLVTIIGILGDNAIEAARESQEKSISIAYFKMDNQQFFVIENAIKEEQVQISHIFEYGYSSKGKGRGIGLANVERIISSYDNVSLATMSSDYLFRQTLSMMEQN
ncbi:GHKL domain-containing protein [Streptococcus dentapri]|uniref:GHKL domain-containing protein n=1 Tax=Streptococcus dentapri TaxID=573564 RepID=A0ABV8CYU2_9STRE